MPIETVHITESLTRLGGVETLVKQLISNGDNHYAASILDAPDTGLKKGFGLRVNKFSNAHSVRRQARKHFSNARNLVFHNFAGLTMLSGAIPHQKRALFLHTNSDDVFDLLPHKLPYIDLIIASGADLASEIIDRFPSIDVPVTPVEYPLDDCYFNTEDNPSHKLTIGYAGRIEHEQKKVTRLVDFCNQLSSIGLDYTFEIAGYGNAMHELKEKLPVKHCRFLGSLDPHSLAHAYKSWDFMICTSDYETGPLVAMEAMASGVLPILPDIPCQATKIFKNIGFPVYAAGNMQDAASLISKLLDFKTRSSWKFLLRKSVIDRRVSVFVQTIDKILEQQPYGQILSSCPAIPKSGSEWLPFKFRNASQNFLR